MVKKILLASAMTTLAAANIAMANPPAPYVGGSIGITNNSVTVKNESTVGTYRGVPLNLFAGYGGVVNENFYLAGEIFGTLATANISESSNALKSSYGYGAAIIPGVMLSDHTLAYVRGGVVRARFPKVNEFRTGAQFGAGMQTTLTQNLDLRGEYDFVAYKSKDMYGVNNQKVSVAPRADQFSVGLVYKFD